ncbi:MAG: hypothetical protein ACRD20_15675 [Terriglobales bacterium]
MSNHPEGAISGIVVFAVIFFFPGYLLLTLLDPHMGGGLRTLLSPVVGIVSITTAYDICARASLAAFFPILMVILSIAGAVRFALRARHAPAWTRWTRNRIEVLTAGCVTALGIAPLYWRSGRFSGREFVFYGPAGQDPLFHVTLLQRLLHHIPPDNFIVSGLRAPVYHYFDDLTLALLLRTQNALHLGATDVFDLYYRCYPVVVYFLLGALAYRTGRQLLGSARGGVLSVLLLLGGGGLGWFFGALQTVAHGSQFAAMRASLFSDWTSWDGIDSILPLVHRPAHYHGLIICLAAINVLLRPASRRNWLLAALLLGLMAGFNFTLAATFGIAAVLGSLIFLLRRQQYEARNLAWFALFVFIGSLPVNVGMLLDGLHNVAPGLPFRGPNLQFPAATWGPLLGRITPAALVPWAALILLPIVAYGVKLSGLRSMARLDLGEIRHRGTAMVFAIAFTLSFVLGMFFPYQAFGGVGIIFLQPTLWMLALFSLHPIYSWLNKHKGNWRPVVLWGMLGLTWIQALAAFNFSHRVAFRRDTTIALQKIRSTAAPGDVIAYLPSSLTERPILGPPADSTNFAVMAMTGLDGYFSSEPYSKFFAVPGLSGRGRDSAEVLAQAEQLYERRRDDVASFVKGDIDNATAARLARDNLCWIVVSGDAIQGISSPATPWYKTDDIVIYRLVVR